MWECVCSSPLHVAVLTSQAVSPAEPGRMRLLQSSARCRAYVAGRQNGHRQFRSCGARQNALKEYVNANFRNANETSPWGDGNLADRVFIKIFFQFQK